MRGGGGGIGRVEAKGRKRGCPWTARVRLPSYYVTSSVTQSNERKDPHGRDEEARWRARSTRHHPRGSFPKVNYPDYAYLSSGSGLVPRLCRGINFVYPIGTPAGVKRASFRVTSGSLTLADIAGRFLLAERTIDTLRPSVHECEENL